VGSLTFVLLPGTRQSGMFSSSKKITMKKILVFILLSAVTFLYAQAQPPKQTVKPVPEYDTIIRKHVVKPPVKKVVKPVAKPEEAKPAVKPELVLPTPEFINQPNYYDKDDNRLIKLESASAQMVTKKKTLGLKGAKQFLSMDVASSRVRFIAKKDIVFFIKTTGDVIDLTSYIKLYQFLSADQKRQVTINAKEGLLNNKEEGKGKLMSFSVKMVSKDNYMIQLSDQLEAGEYGFVWVKNMEQNEFTVFAFGIDWKSSD
jgi:hypothetical protein